MVGLVARRLAQAIPTLLLVSLVVFGLAAVAPVDPARAALTAGGGAGIHIDEAALQTKRTELGLDRPLPERYLRWLRDFVRLELGRSFVTGRPVAALLAERFPASAVLGLMALILSLGISLPAGVLSAVRAGSVWDWLGRGLALLGASVPGFWLALVLMWLLAAQLRLLPALGSLTPSGLVLPVLVLAIRPLGRQLRLMRAATLDALVADHLLVARSKGLSESVVVRRHVLPNAILPQVTLLGLDLPALVSSAVIVESVFAWPGIGRMAADAALAGDVPVLMGFVMLVGILVVASSFLVDVVYAVLDPRQRTPGRLVA